MKNFVRTTALVAAAFVGFSTAAMAAPKKVSAASCRPAAMNVVVATFKQIDIARSQPITPRVPGEDEYLAGCWATGIVDKEGQTFSAILTVDDGGEPQALYSGGTLWRPMGLEAVAPAGHLSFEAGGHQWVTPLPVPAVKEASASERAESAFLAEAALSLMRGSVVPGAMADGGGSEPFVLFEPDDGEDEAPVRYYFASVK